MDPEWDHEGPHSRRSCVRTVSNGSQDAHTCDGKLRIHTDVCARFILGFPPAHLEPPTVTIWKLTTHRPFLPCVGPGYSCIL